MAYCASASLSPWSMASLRAALPPGSSTSVPRVPSLIRFKPLSAAPAAPTLRLRSFSGLAAHSLALSPLGSGPFQFPSVSNGGRVYAMRHGKRVPRLNRPPDQRRALLRGLTTQILRYGRIKTTRARASAVRKYVDKMITLAKDGSLHKRRQALGFIYDKQLVHALFAEVAERYGDRDGGYTRITRLLPRRGDNAPMAYIELV